MTRESKAGFNRTNPNTLPRAFFKARGLLMAPLVIFAFLFTRWEWERNVAILGIGLPLFLLGVGLRCWAQRHFKYRVKTAGDRKLASTGPFTYCRNPVYIGNLMLFTGIVVLCELFWMVPIVLLWGGLVYSLAVQYEEARLAKRFGIEYALYRQSVPRWLPAIPTMNFGSALAGIQPATWLEVVKAEWQCLVLLLIPLIKEVGPTWVG